MASRFTPPTLEQCEAYKAEKGYRFVDGATFFLFYESNGWKVGRNKMVSWHSAMAGWEAREIAKRKIPGKCLIHGKRAGAQFKVYNGKKKWLCGPCSTIAAWDNYDWTKDSPSVIEKKIKEIHIRMEKHWANRRQTRQDYSNTLKTVPNQPNQRATINRLKDGLKLRH
jgi:hypothetical protein